MNGVDMSLPPLVNVKLNITKTTRRSARAYKIGEWILVSKAEDGKNYFIYNANGDKIISAAFRDRDKAIKFARFLDEKYREFFPLWIEYPDADIFALAKWTVEKGIQIDEIIKLIERKGIC